MDKRNKEVIILGVALLAILSFCQVEAQNLPIYSIVGSNSIKEGSSFRFSMLSKNLNEPLQANFSLSGTDKNGKFLSLSRLNVIVLVNDAQNFELDTSEFYSGQYTFQANVYDPSNNNMVFDTWPLQFLPQVFHILIQTDKQLYRAEDLIRFRLFAFDADTKPVNIRGSSLVSIINPLGFVVSEFANVTFVNGRFNEEFQLANIVSTGLWIIRVQVDEKIFEKTIEIEQYELPLFTAHIDVPVYVAISDGSFPVRINVDYAFGKTMHGVALVRFIRFGQLAIFEKTLTLGNEIGLFDVNIATNLGITSDETVDIELEFTDAMSDKKINATAATRLRKISTILDLKASPTFKRNVVYDFVIIAKGYDGLPVENTDINVEILLQEECVQEDDESEWICPEETVTRTYSTNNNGIVEGEIATADFNYITIEAKCTACEAANFFAEFHEPLFEIIVTSERPTVNEPIKVVVSTVHEIQSAFCYFLAKNVHLDLKVITFINGDAEFEFIPNGEFTPVTQITCVGIDVFGQRHDAQKDVTFEQLPSKVNIEILSPTIEPGMNASLRVSGALHSTVSLLAMDQRLLNLQKSRSLGDPWVNLRNQLMLFMRNQAQNSFNFEMLRMPNPITTTTDKLETAPTVLPRKIGPKTRAPMFRRRKLSKSFVFAADEEDAPRLRRNFQETFLWVDVEIENPSEDDPTQGSEVIFFETPDSITAFAISGFSLSPSDGAGILDNPVSIMNFMPFFIEADLPFSMKQSETLLQTVTIFNYMDEDVEVYVTIARTENDPDFYIINEQMEWNVLTNFYGRSFSSSRGSIRSFIIGIRPLKTGLIPITISATGPSARDSIIRNLRVIPAGIERVITDSILLLKEGSATASTELSCNIPDDIDQSTISTQITFVGDLLGDVIANMAALLIQPSGCGEQNMARFSSAVVSYHYFKASHQLTDAIANTIISYTQQGMQKHLTLRRPNGGFSFFTSNQGSTWLTAFTVKIFKLAEEFTTIDNALITSALDFILSKQAADGGFEEDQVSDYYRHYGGLNSKVAVTSYIAILFTQLLSEQPQLRAARDNAITFSLQNVNDSNAYELAITCNALYYANHNSFNAKYNTLLGLSTVTDEHLYWNVQAQTVLNVETTAYALLFMHKIDADRSVKMVRYLISMKNQNGGWASTQDTVMAVEALAESATYGLLGLLAGNMTVLAWPDVGQSIETLIDHTNQIQLQSFTLDDRTRNIQVFARGLTSGKTTVSFTCKYFENIAAGDPRFRVTHTLVEECNTPLRSFICINYIPEGNDIISNMVIMKMRMPSGYIYDTDTPMPEVIRKIEAEDENSRIVAYFDSMSDQRVCFTINAIQTSIVIDETLQVLIQVNDYYSPEKKAEQFFQIPGNLQRC